MKVKKAKLLLIAAVFLIVFIPPFAKYQELQYKNRKLEERIIALQLENKRLEVQERLLQTDVNYVEKKAREKIGLVRKGEIVIKDR